MVSEGIVDSDLSADLVENIRCQTGLVAFNGKVIAYKQVRRDLTSIYDNRFKYKVGEIAEAETWADNKKSCAAGLHFSNSTRWNADIENPTYLVAEIKLEDIITVQEGKIRCKKAFILGKYDKM